MHGFCRSGASSFSHQPFLQLCQNLTNLCDSPFKFQTKLQWLKWSSKIKFWKPKEEMWCWTNKQKNNLNTNQNKKNCFFICICTKMIDPEMKKRKTQVPWWELKGITLEWNWRETRQPIMCLIGLEAEIWLSSQFDSPWLTRIDFSTCTRELIPLSLSFSSKLGFKTINY